MNAVSRALITGIRGAAGTYLADYLRTQGIEICGIARPECNLLDFQAVCDRLLEVRPDVIYHLAADANVREAFDKPAQVFSNNTGATINLFEAVRKVGIDPVIMVCSSSEVYGNNPWPFRIAENFRNRPNNPYAVSKMSQDLFAQMYGRDYGMRVVITRAFSYVNPLRRDLALSNFAAQIAAIERGQGGEVLHGNLDSLRTFCDVRDVVKAFAFVPELPTVSKVRDEDGIYNIGGSDRFSIGQCLDMLVSLARVPVKTRQDPKLLRTTDVTNQIPDCRRFHELTGWTPRIPIRESLEWLLNHYRLNGA